MRRTSFQAASLIALALVALPLASESAGQSTGGGGSLRSGFSGNGTQNRLPFSSSAGRGSQGRRNALGTTGGGPLGDAASGQAGNQQGPLNANLAQSGRERFQQDGFVGRDAEDVREGFENTRRQGRGQMLDQMIDNLNEMRESRRRWREQNAAPPPVRVQLRPSFAMPPQVAAQTTAAAQERLTRSMLASGVVAPQAEFAGRIVVLRGTAATEHQRAIVGQLAALEPGVSRVENLVTIQPPPAAPR